MQHLFSQETHEPVDLPADLRDFRGDLHHVIEIADESSPGRSGRVLVACGDKDTRTLYPTVFNCYLAVEPREAL